MDKANHPFRDELISIDHYNLHFGHKDIAGNMSPPARCFCCNGPMRIKAATSKFESHFYHAIQGSNCPTIEPNKAPYETLPPYQFDRDHFEAGKAFLRLNWLPVYIRFKAILPATMPEEFMEAIEELANRNILRYADLQWEMMPYYMVALGNFTTKTGIRTGRFKRDFSFRFFFSQNLGRAQGLWIKERETPPLFRASYKGKKIISVGKRIDLIPVHPGDGVNAFIEDMRKNRPWELDSMPARQDRVNQLFPAGN